MWPHSKTSQVAALTTTRSGAAQTVGRWGAGGRGLTTAQVAVVQTAGCGAQDEPRGSGGDCGAPRTHRESAAQEGGGAGTQAGRLDDDQVG